MSEKSLGQAEAALKLVLDQKPELYINLVGQPMIRLPTANGPTSAEIWSIRSHRVKGWIAEVIWQQLNVVLLEREIDRVITVLIGKAWHDQRNKIDLMEAIDQDPLLDALLIFMHEHPSFDKNCTSLGSELDKVAKSSGLDTRSSLWPKGAPQLSRRIGELQLLLETAGIATKIGRRANGVRFVELTRSKTGDGGQPPSSQVPSVDKSHHPGNLTRLDDPDGVSRKQLFDQLTPVRGNANERH